MTNNVPNVRPTCTKSWNKKFYLMRIIINSRWQNNSAFTGTQTDQNQAIIQFYRTTIQTMIDSEGRQLTTMIFKSHIPILKKRYVNVSHTTYKEHKYIYIHLCEKNHGLKQATTNLLINVRGDKCSQLSYMVDCWFLINAIFRQSQKRIKWWVSRKFITAGFVML